jgi:predicted pyridoxine 5'-phosphate oxidase superfamily flavin-nucleotide-binding protein
MVKIPQEIREFLKVHLAYVATADAKGMPNVVPKVDIAILGENEIVFADLYSHQTKKNLKQNPHISICVVNPASYTGYQLKGKAKIIERGKEYDALANQVSGTGQLNHIEAKYAVKVKVSKIIDIGYSHTADKEIGH